MKKLFIAITLSVVSIAAQANVKSWCEVEADPKFKALTYSQQLEVKNNYIAKFGYSSINKCEH